MPWEHLGVGVDAGLGEVDGDGRLAEAGGDEFELAVEGRDIADGEDAGHIGFHEAVDGDGFLVEFERPFFDGSAQRRDESELHEEGVDLERAFFLGLVVADVDARELAVGGDEGFDLPEGEDGGLGGLESADGIFVGAELVAAMDDGDARAVAAEGGFAEVEGPVDGGVAAAGDQDAFAGEDGFGFAGVVKAAVFQGGGFLEGEPARGKSARAGGDDEGAGVVDAVVGGELVDSDAFGDGAPWISEGSLAASAAVLSAVRVWTVSPRQMVAIRN